MADGGEAAFDWRQTVERGFPGVVASLPLALPT